MAQDPLDLRREAVVGHAVGLVEARRSGRDRGRPRSTSAGRSAAAAWRRRARRHWRAPRSAGDGWRRRRRRAPHAGLRRPPGSSTSATCSASSRVGTSTSPSGALGSATSVMRASIGTPKASVLPEPVWARPHTSRPCSATGIASVWIANGCAKPAAASPRSMRSGTPRAANPVGASTGGSTLMVVRLPADGPASPLPATDRSWWWVGRRGWRRRRGALRRPPGRTLGRS